ncbi:MAG: 3-dehydroquinate synthase [Aestuariivirgaceae bacterium]
MTDTEKTVRVELAGRSYDILICSGSLPEAGRILAPLLARPRLVVVTDDNVASLHLDQLTAALTGAGISSRSIVLPHGEATKSFSRLADLCDRLLAEGVERNDMIAALGGGVIGDLTGFAAAILRRGIAYAQLPTTLLAQVDSAVGGKTGINTKLGKNLIGAFHQPSLVIADTELLRTLPQREFRAGYAEVVKYGLLGDREFYDWLDRNSEALGQGNQSALRHAVAVCCATKARIVAADETENNDRALLNLGHTFGHALEAAAGYSSRLLHGEAVAIGMAMAFRFSASLGVCSPADAAEVARHLDRSGLPVSPRQIDGGAPSARQLLDLMHQDKKTRSGRLTFILVNGIGRAFIAPDLDQERLLSFLASELE